MKTALKVALFSMLPFLPALAAGFVNIDDDHNFLLNERFRGMSLSHLRWMFADYQLGGTYQPLAWITHAGDWLVWGLNPFGHHLTSVLLHGASAAAFYLLAREIVPGGAVFAALFFSVHPLRVEVVAWVSNRSYVLPGLFYLLAAWCYLKNRRALCYLAFLASVFSKAIGMTFPLVLLAMDYALERPFRLLDKLPLFAISAAAGAIAAKGRILFGSMVPLDQWGGLDRLAQALYGCVFYLEKTFIPLCLSPIYPLPEAMHPLDQACHLRTIAFVIITALATRRRWVLGAWAAYVLMLLPFLGLSTYGLQIQVAADKWCHLASIPVALVAGAAFTRYANGRGARIAAACILLALGVRAAHQTYQWRNTEALLTYAASVQPGSQFVENNLSGHYNNTGRPTEALHHALKALRYKVDYPMAVTNAAVACTALGDYTEALNLQQRVTDRNPYDAEAHFFLGYIHYKAGHLALAIVETQHALEINPAHAGARQNADFFRLQQVNRP